MDKKKTKILAIDDNPDNLISLVALINESFNNIEIHTARSGQAGIIWAKKEDPDVILLDIFMPEMDGYSVCKTIKKTDKTKDIPIVFVTAQRAKETRLKALEAGGDAFISKPIDKSELIAQIKAMVKIKQANTQKRDEKERLSALVTEKTQSLKEELLAHKSTTRALKISERKFSSIFNNMVAGCCFDEIIYENGQPIDYRIIDINKAFEQIMNLNRDQVVGKLATEVYKTKQLPFFDIFCRVEKTNQHETFTTYYKPLNKHIQITTICPEKGKFSNMIVDISERILMEKELKNNKRILTEAERTAKIGGWEFDPITGEQTWTEEVFRILEMDTTSHAPAIPQGVEFIASEYISNAETAIKRAIEYGEPYHQEWEVITAKGNRRWVYAVGKAQQVDGKTVKVSGSFQDITDRKKYELLLQEQKEEIEVQSEEFRQLNAQLQKTNSELEISKLSLEKFLVTKEQQMLEIELQNERLESLMRISQYKYKNRQDFLDFALSEAINLTTSIMGYILFYNEKTRMLKLSAHSKEVIHECMPLDREIEYHLADTGCWSEAIKQRKPFIVNNRFEIFEENIEFSEGHKKPNKLLAIPIFSDDEIVAVIGVANKPDDYNQSDIRQLTLLMDTVWRILEREVIFEKLIQAKAEAEESELRFKALHNASFGGITIHDKGLILDCNQGLCDLTGYSSEELIGMDGLLLISEKTRELVLNNILTNFEKPYEAIGVRKNGEEYYLRLEARSIPYKSKQVRVVEFRDITQQKKDEIKIKENEEKLKFLFDNMIQGVVYHNADGDIIYTNHAAELILGLPAEKINGMSSIDPAWHAIHENGSAFAEDDHPSVMAYKTGKPVHNVKMGIYNPATENLKWININALPRFQNGDPKPFQVVSTFQDITEIRKATKELISAKERAEESDRLKSAFLANMSHEIRTPMNGILGFTSLLKEPKLEGYSQQKYIDIIEKSGARMLNIINDIISISKVEAGQMEVSLSDTVISQQLEYISNFFRPETERKGLNLTIKNNLTSECSIVKTDSDKLAAVLTNLVKNAIKFTHKGSIEVGCHHKGGFIEFWVKDTGSGIPTDKVNIVFERFRQGSESLTRNYEGAGLGLAISKAYVELLGGQIWLESKENIGSQFYFTIPNNNSIHDTTSEQPEHTIQHSPIDIRPLKVLIAEDDEASEMFISIALKHITKEIILVKTGYDALEACRSHTDIDLILMDIRMPVMDGLTATKKIRDFNEDIIIIAQTAFGLIGDRETALEAGCNDYISKPIRKNQLLQLINKHFKSKPN